MSGEICHLLEASVCCHSSGTIYVDLPVGEPHGCVHLILSYYAHVLSLISRRSSWAKVQTFISVFDRVVETRLQRTSDLFRELLLTGDARSGRCPHPPTITAILQSGSSRSHPITVASRGRVSSKQLLRSVVALLQIATHYLQPADKELLRVALANMNVSNTFMRRRVSHHEAALAASDAVHAAAF